MKGVAIGRWARFLRRPYYASWRTLRRIAWEGREYSLLVPAGNLIYTPWFSYQSEFRRLLKVVQKGGPITVSSERSYLLHSLCKQALTREGELAECGVFTGGTAHLLAATVRNREGETPPRNLHLFDTFAGMPNLARPERDYHSPGDFAATSLEVVLRRLKGYRFTKFHPGVIPQSFAEVEGVNRYCFVHVDVDIYPTVLECCKWFWPRLVSGGIMVFDDYGFRPYRLAARAAVDEFFRGCREEPIAMATGQGIVLKA